MQQWPKDQNNSKINIEQVLSAAALPVRLQYIC